MPKKANLLPQAESLSAAIEDLKIDVPIYAVEEVPGGLKLYLYGHAEPVLWKPEPDPGKAKASPKSRLRRKPKTRKPVPSTAKGEAA